MSRLYGLPGSTRHERGSPKEPGLEENEVRAVFFRLCISCVAIVRELRRRGLEARSVSNSPLSPTALGNKFGRIGRMWIRSIVFIKLLSTSSLAAWSGIVKRRGLAF